LKAWLGLLWPDAEQGEKIRRMDFRRFVANFIAIPCQAVRSGRRIIHRFLAFNGWLASLFDAHAAIKTLKIQ
ncbi:MAG: IS1380 family transposase, partial [Planctomycetes bacterium]|nr:IS1380 family transposase [Planctomycetota bacterium]